MKAFLLIIFTAILFIPISALGQGLKIGDKAPDIVQQSIDGSSLSLSSFEGYIVLVDFWASWCAPCRKENPNLVEAYQLYKDASFADAKGFIILSVSLDMREPAWKKAIEDDQLNWPYHVSDLKGWRNEAAQLYGVKSIPASYLLDADGTIIAINLRGEELHKKLKKLQRKGWYRFWE